MNEEILRALMQLFAIIAKVNKEGDVGLSKTIVRSYLKQHLNKKTQNEFLDLFDEYVRIHHAGAEEATKNRKRTSSNSVKVLQICHQINENLQQPQKVVVLIQLLEFTRIGTEVTQKELEFVETVAETFNISSLEYASIYNFIFDNIQLIPDKARYLEISETSSNKVEGAKHIWRDNLDGAVRFLHINSTNMYAFKYIGTSNMYLNGLNIPIDRTLILDKGSSIRSPKTKPIYYSDIVGEFLHSEVETKILFNAVDVEFRFKNSENGIQKFNFSEESGELIGIMGGSGVGKSTLLNVLNGNLKPQSGCITINGIDIHEENDKLKGIIGFVPQDDLLIEELNVYQNLYYNAKLCFADYTEEQIDVSVNKVLHDLDLYEIRNLSVGSPLNKFISGGQRKRLNIALELIREPSVLFVDEPTSGLSSMDSDMVMDLLKEQALKGKLVIVNIHQPSSDIYKMFDKLLIMDRGGFLIYYGNPIDAITYFKRQSNYVNADESECITCGNVNPEQVLQIIEARVVDEYGKLTKNRKVSSKEWHEIFMSEIQSKKSSRKQDFPLPANNFKLPGLATQFKIFLTRNILSKLTNHQYLLITFLEAPLLALILGYFSKYVAGVAGNDDMFVFSLNENLPSYLFMAVVCSLFLGMTISAEEIIKDQKILQRERFLNLSKLSYINSKVVLMFFISAIQTITFLLVGNCILEIKGQLLTYFVILFSTACFANILGLNISASMNSVVTIYITIPFILVPQLLLSGVIVKFEKLHKSIASYQYVSIAGDLMTSRWAYEALAVNQFKNNLYQKNLYEIEREMSDAAFKKNFLIPELITTLDYLKNNRQVDSLRKQKESRFSVLRTEIGIIEETDKIVFGLRDSLRMESFTPGLYKNTKNYLFKLKEHFDDKYNRLYYKKDQKFREMIDKYGTKGVVLMKERYHNEALADLVLNNNELNKIVKKEDRMVQFMEPIYRKPEHPLGRAHFYASKKKIFDWEVDTVSFNIVVIWLTTLLLYMTLVTNAFKAVIDRMSSMRILKWLKPE